MKKLLFTMHFNNWEPEITKLTFPLMKYYAKKINAEFGIINKRKYPDCPMGFERFQIYDEMPNYDWVIHVDGDFLIHPDMPDVTPLVQKDTVIMSTWDWAPKRFKMDEYFYRDGRFISVPNIFTAVSNWCREFWKLPEDLDTQTIVNNCTPCLHEWGGRGVDRSHMVEDYITSRNVAKYGLKVQSLQNIFSACSQPGRMKLGEIEDFVMHNSYLPIHQKRQHIHDTVYKYWKIDPLQPPISQG